MIPLQALPGIEAGGAPKTGNDRAAIMVDFKYKLMQDVIEQTQIDVNERTPELFARDLDWAAGSYRTMFGG